ncbi:hypothetical protein ACOMHN_001181 [Nucella lapillus]
MDKKALLASNVYLRDDFCGAIMPILACSIVVPSCPFLPTVLWCHHAHSCLQYCGAIMPILACSIVVIH